MKALSEEPQGADPRVVELWKKLKPLNTTELEKFWNKVEPTAAMLDLTNVSYSQKVEGGQNVMQTFREVDGKV